MNFISRFHAALAILAAHSTFLVTTTYAFSFPALDGLRSRAKTDLIEQVTAGASNEDVLKAINNVERYSIFTKDGGATLKNPSLQGNWLMVWTTSDSIAGKSRPSIFRTSTPPEQFIDVENLRAVNAEYILGIRNSVEAKLTPETKNKVKVQFKKFKVGPVSFTPDPDKFKGELAVTYLDEDMRISRGDKGNAFILLKEDSQRKEANAIWKDWRKNGGW